MGCSFTAFRGHGFWARDESLKLWLSLLAQEARRLDDAGPWLVEAAHAWQEQAATAQRGWVAAGLDECATTPKRIAVLLALSWHVLDDLLRQGPVLSAVFLNSLETGPDLVFTRDLRTEALYRLGRAFIRLLRGKAGRGASHAPAARSGPDEEAATETHFTTYQRALGHCRDPQGVLGQEWVVHPPSPDYRYDATPRNALTFGSMGVDGVHYAVLTINGAVRYDSPVVQVCPMDFSDLYQVLAESFLSYLAGGCGVTPAEMEQVFAEERAGKPVLVPFLKKRFEQSRLGGEDGCPMLDRLLDLIEAKPS